MLERYKNWLIARPLLGALTTIVIFVLGRYLLLALSSGPTADVWLKTIYRYGAAFVLIGLLVAMGWASGAGVTRPVSAWRRWWWLAALPITLLALINFINIDFDRVTFGLSELVGWVIFNFGVGLFEETLLRGFVFYVLYRAWGQTRAGLFRAAFTQAIIFGLIHYLNLLTGSSFLAVSSQVIWATLLGIGFAGVVAFARSIWPAIFAHAIIDMLGSVDEFFGPEEISSAVADKALEDVVTLVIIVAVVAALPGLWLLYKADLHSPDG